MAPPLTDLQREQIITLWGRGYKIADICREVKTTKKTVGCWIRRYEKHGATVAYRRKAYSRSTTSAEDNEIIEAHSSNPFKNTTITASKYNVSIVTIRRRLREAGLELSTGRKARRIMQRKTKAKAELGEMRRAWLRGDPKSKDSKQQLRKDSDKVNPRPGLLQSSTSDNSHPPPTVRRATKRRSAVYKDTGDFGAGDNLSIDYSMPAAADFEVPIRLTDEGLDDPVCAEDGQDELFRSADDKDDLDDTKCTEVDIEYPISVKDDLDELLSAKDALGDLIRAKDDMGDLIRAKEDMGDLIQAKDNSKDFIEVHVKREEEEYQTSTVKDTNIDKESVQLPRDHYCKGCSSAITGFRYVCVQCGEVALCGACEVAGLHALHYVLRVPRRRPHEEVTTILDKIREELVKYETALKSIKPEVKEEVDLTEVPENVHTDTDALMDAQSMYDESEMMYSTFDVTDASSQTSVDVSNKSSQTGTQQTYHLNDHSYVNTRKELPVWINEDVLDTPDIKDEDEDEEEAMSETSVDEEEDGSSSDPMTVGPASIVHGRDLEVAYNVATATRLREVMIEPWPGMNSAPPMMVLQRPHCVPIPDAPQTRFAIVPGKYVFEVDGLVTTRKENMLPED